MGSQLARIVRRFKFGIIGVVILLLVFLVQNPMVQDHLPIIGNNTCADVAEWDKESIPHRPNFILRLSEFGEYEEWTDADYDQVIHEIDDHLAWFEENPGPEDANGARKLYVTNLSAVREILVDARNGEYESEAEFTNTLNPYDMVLNDPATDFVALCQ